jgi:hypothetical protein
MLNHPGCQVPALLVIIPALVLMFMLMLTLVMTKVQPLIILILWVSIAFQKNNYTITVGKPFTRARPERI